ncbi:hypothetical protein [Streptomyces winkii]|uniref:hypothetical protein n=1 Tax=Streptomyces winkii TaxID=3051178 RepID=UPI0028D83EB6|nr:hypothetical protein [Streptomyces sp. DSM 40971]
MVRLVRRTAPPLVPPPPAASPSARRRPSQAQLAGILLAVLLALFGGSAVAPHQPDLHGGPVQSQSAATHHQDPPQHLQGAISHPAHAATQAPLPLLPAVEQYGPEPRRGSVLPERPQLSAEHLTHRSPRHGRAPPAAQASET